MKRIFTLLILLSITNFYAQTYTHNSKVRVKNTDTAADTDNLVTIDGNGLLKRSTQTVSQLVSSAPTLDNVLTSGNTTTQIPIFNGGFNSVFGVISNTLDFSRASNSLFTIRESSTGTGTTVSQFIDVTRTNTVDASTAQTFGIVSRSVSTSSNSNQGLIGANLIGRDNGTGDLDYVYGTITQADALSSGSIDFLTADVLRTNITGSGASTINIARGLSTDLVLDNANTTVADLQAMHPSIQLNNGTADDVVNLYLDLDWDNTGSTTVTGDIAYIRAGNDPLPTPTGNTYFIKSDVTHPSEFAGSITATDFIGNFDGQPSSYYDFREFGLGTGAATNPAFTGDVLTIADTGFRRVAFSASNLPVAENGFLSSIYRVGSFKTYNFISDSGSVYRYAGGSWHEMAKKSDINNVLDTSTSDLITTSTLVNDEVYSFTIPANTLSVGDVLKIRFEGIDNSGDTTNKTMQLELAGQSVNVSNFISTLYSNNERFTVETEIIITSTTGFRYSTEMKVQRNIAGMNLYGNIFDGDKSTGTFDITASNDVTLDLNNAVNGDLEIKTISVKLFKN